MGILNVTPDSSSDDGAWFDTARAIGHGLSLAAEGADITTAEGPGPGPGPGDLIVAVREEGVQLGFGERALPWIGFVVLLSVAVSHIRKAQSTFFAVIHRSRALAESA